MLPFRYKPGRPDRTKKVLRFMKDEEEKEIITAAKEANRSRFSVDEQS